MAASGTLPTYQRYVNGVPVPQNRKTLRLKEKYIVLLVFVTFGTVCFGAFFFLPDLRDRVSVNSLRQVQVGVGDIFVPKPVDIADGRVFNSNRHGEPDEADPHKLDSRSRFDSVVKANREGIPDQVKRNLSNIVGHEQIKEEIERDKDKVIKEREKIEKEIEEAKKQNNIKEVKDHGGIEGGQGGIPTDDKTRERQESIKAVRPSPGADTGAGRRGPWPRPLAKVAPSNRINVRLARNNFRNHCSWPPFKILYPPRSPLRSSCYKVDGVII